MNSSAFFVMAIPATVAVAGGALAALWKPSHAMRSLIQHFAAGVVFSVVGVVIFCLGFVILDKLTPYNLWQELIEKKNTALALVVGFACLGVALIIAACLHG